MTPAETNGNADWWADRTLTVWAGPGYLHFTTYNFCQRGCDNFNVVQNIDYSNQLGSWFFIHYAYDYKQQRAKGYVRFDNGREQEIVFSGLLHMLPDNLNFQLGVDKWHAAFNGLMNGFHVTYGPGAYVPGITDYRKIMFRDNPQSVKVENSVAKNLVLLENSTSG
jgi:hypothetical protein